MYNLFSLEYRYRLRYDNVFQKKMENFNTGKNLLKYLWKKNMLDKYLLISILNCQFQGRNVILTIDIFDNRDY